MSFPDRDFQYFSKHPIGFIPSSPGVLPVPIQCHVSASPEHTEFRVRQSTQWLLSTGMTSDVGIAFRVVTAHVNPFVRGTAPDITPLYEIGKGSASGTDKNIVKSVHEFIAAPERESSPRSLFVREQVSVLCPDTSRHNPIVTVQWDSGV